MTSFPLKGQAWGGAAADFGIADIACDPTQAGLIYVTLFATGAQVIWRGRIAGGSAAWEDITLNAPKWQDLSVSVLPGSGDVVVGGGVGGWVLSAPAGYVATRGDAPVWPGLPDPVRRF